MPLELREALERDEHRSHPIALGQDDLVELAALERINQTIELPHRLADGGELVVGDPNGGG